MDLNGVQIGPQRKVAILCFVGLKLKGIAKITFFKNLIFFISILISKVIYQSASIRISCLQGVPIIFRQFKKLVFLDTLF